ncbi:MAG: hypothetical protein WBL28_05200 [Methylotenera sp.]
MDNLSHVEAELERHFPQRLVGGVITPHECEECAAIRQYLGPLTWSQVSDAFAEQFSGSLPLLSPDAYNAYLPAWVRAALHKPDGDVAGIILINLADEPPMEHFTQGQAQSLLRAARLFVTINPWGVDDPVNVERLAEVERTWATRSAA